MKKESIASGARRINIPDCVLPVLKKDTNQQRVCGIIGEFIEGFNFIGEIDKAITIFGSARIAQDTIHYQQAKELAGLLAKEKITVITGGGPGIMEAANQGAFLAKGESIGVNIQIPKHQPSNVYATKSITFRHFYARKLMMVAASFGYVFFPGGFGTLDEFFEIMNLAETQELGRTPLIVVVGKDYWEPLFDWLKTNVAKKHASINVEDLDVIQIADSADEAMDIIKRAMSS